MEHADTDNVQHVLRSFRKINKAIYHMLREEADKLEMTAIQVLVLIALERKPDSCLSQLAEQLELGNSTMSGIVERLVHAGFIVRGRSGIDRRLLTLRLTAKGEEKQKEAYNQAIKRLSVKLQGISENDFKDLLALHERLLEYLQ